jgi:E3 ubiquitin-protein ligase SH3RF
VPTLPPKPGTAAFFPATPTRPSRPNKPAAAGATSGIAGHQIFRALFDYTPKKADELGLSKSELYVVIEKCEDGWFKGSSVNHLKTGVFPGNYVQHISEGVAAPPPVPVYSRSKVLEPTKMLPSSSSNRSLNSELQQQPQKRYVTN